jgi:hypothetical protein
VRWRRKCRRSAPTVRGSPPSSTARRPARAISSRTNREIAQRLDVAIESIRAVIRDLSHEPRERHHSWPPVPHGLRGRAGRASDPLAKDLDQRVEQLKKNFGAIGDMRLIVMAALTSATS